MEGHDEKGGHQTRTIVTFPASKFDFEKWVRMYLIYFRRGRNDHHLNVIVTIFNPNCQLYFIIPFETGKGGTREAETSFFLIIFFSVRTVWQSSFSILFQSNFTSLNFINGLLYKLIMMVSYGDKIGGRTTIACIYNRTNQHLPQAVCKMPAIFHIIRALRRIATTVLGL